MALPGRVLRIRHKNRLGARLAHADVLIYRVKLAGRTSHGYGPLPPSWAERREQLASEYRDALAILEREREEKRRAFERELEREAWEWWRLNHTGGD